MTKVPGTERGSWKRRQGEMGKREQARLEGGSPVVYTSNVADIGNSVCDSRQGRRWVCPEGRERRVPMLAQQSSARKSGGSMGRSSGMNSSSSGSSSDTSSHSSHIPSMALKKPGVVSVRVNSYTNFDAGDHDIDSVTNVLNESVLIAQREVR